MGGHHNNGSVTAALGEARLVFSFAIPDQLITKPFISQSLQGNMALAWSFVAAGSLGSKNTPAPRGGEGGGGALCLGGGGGGKLSNITLTRV